MKESITACNIFFLRISLVIIVICVSSCGKAVKSNEKDTDNQNTRQYLQSKSINLSANTSEYSFPGNAQIFIPGFIKYHGGENQNYLQLVFSKGVFMQEFICYYAYSQNSYDFELDECYLTDDTRESLQYKPGQSIFQAKDDIIELKSYNSQVNAEIEVDWFSKSF